jgi:hypothetical protein
VVVFGDVRAVVVFMLLGGRNKLFIIIIIIPYEYTRVITVIALLHHYLRSESFLHTAPIDLTALW